MRLIFSQRETAYGAIRILFGLVCATNVLLQTNPAYIEHFLGSFAADWVSGQPHWLAAYGHWMAAGVAALGPAAVAWGGVVIDGLLAASLLSGIGLRYLAWFGIVYNLWLWSTVGGLGGPYTAGATDPGTAIAYALVFVFVIATRAWEGLSLHKGTLVRGDSARALNTARILFGMLWAFDAFWKWQPYFLEHALLYLQQAQAGQPVWAASYIGWFLAAFGVIGPFVFGIFAAVCETAIALSLLTGRFLRWMLPFGIIYSLGLWTTAEGWGGPYGAGFTGNKGDVLGTINIYLFAFFFLLASCMLPSRLAVRDASPPRQVP